jgi:hypothetical protein
MTFLSMEVNQFNKFTMELEVEQIIVWLIMPLEELVLGLQEMLKKH